MITEEENKIELKNLLAEKAYRFIYDGKYILASGELSNEYVDCRTVTMAQYGSIQVGKYVSSEIKKIEQKNDLKINLVGGLEFGAYPIAFATAGSILNGMEAISVRKKVKGHGTDKWIEGPWISGNNVVVVEDVFTTGMSTIKAMIRMDDAGLKIAGIVALVNRGGGTAIKNLRNAYRSILCNQDNKLVNVSILTSIEELAELHNAIPCWSPNE